MLVEHRCPDDFPKYAQEVEGARYLVYACTFVGQFGRGRSICSVAEGTVIVLECLEVTMFGGFIARVK